MTSPPTNSSRALSRFAARAYQPALAMRYLLHRPIHLLGIGGVALSVWALIVVVAIFSGYLREVGRHLQSSTADLTAARIPDHVRFDRLARTIRADPNVAECAPRVVWQGLIHPLASAPRRASPAGTSELGADTPFVSVIGVDPALESAVTGLDAWLASVGDENLAVRDIARPLEPHGELPAVLLSRNRMERDGLRVGDRVRMSIARVVTQEPDGNEVLDFDDRDFAVSGTYETRYAAFDGLNVFVAIDTLRSLLSDAGAADWVNEIAIRLRDPSLASETAGRLERALADEFPSPYGGIRVRTWLEANFGQLSSIDHQRSLMKLVLFVIMVVAAFLMYATLSMMVTEKTHDIGILTALGAHRSGVMTVFLMCGLTIGLVGVGIGTVAGCTTAVWLDDINRALRAWLGIDLFPLRIYHLRHVPYELDLHWIVQVAVTALAVALAVSGLPAWRAARHDPLVSLRNE